MLLDQLGHKEPPALLVLRVQPDRPVEFRHLIPVQVPWCRFRGTTPLPWWEQPPFSTFKPTVLLGI